MKKMLFLGFDLDLSHGVVIKVELKKNTRGVIKKYIRKQWF